MMSFLRSLLRRGSLKWAPRNVALANARRPNQSDNKRLKWEFSCAQCSTWHPRKEVECDHIIPAGSLKDWDDLPGFARRLFCEQEGFVVICKPCHNTKTHNK